MNIKNKLNANHIKLIAIVAMTIDHIAWLLFPSFQVVWYVYLLHMIGRLTAPIMWFFIAEGCHYTGDIKKYALRLFFFAILSHFAYNFAFGLSYIPSGIFNQTSVIWSLAWAVVLISLYRNDKIPKWVRTLSTILISLISFPSDWSSIAAMCPLFLYLHRGEFKKQAFYIVIWSFIYATVYFLAIDRLYGILQLFTVLSIPILANYNGKVGKLKGMKWLFYIYYPSHLVIIGIFRIMLHGDIVLLF